MSKHLPYCGTCGEECHPVGYRDGEPICESCALAWIEDAAKDAPEKPDPRDPDYSREGIFQTHNCYRCNNGEEPCARGLKLRYLCDNLHARND